MEVRALPQPEPLVVRDRIELILERAPDGHRSVHLNCESVEDVKELFAHIVAFLDR